MIEYAYPLQLLCVYGKRGCAYFDTAPLFMSANVAQKPYISRIY